MNGNIKEMNTFELSKWMGLMLAVEKIYDHSLKCKKDFNTLELKPLEIRKYIDVVSNKIEHDLQNGKGSYIEF